MIESVNYGNVGPHRWRERSFGKIRKAENQIHKIENASWRPDKLGSTLVHKEICAELSNQEALRHSRDVRNVVVSLQEAIVNSNEEVKRLKSLQNDYEKVLYNVEVDFKINKDSRKIRDSRPSTEGKDGTDDLLNVEAQQLREMRRHLNSTLQVIKEHLRIVGECRNSLLQVQRERKRVLDLLCHDTNKTSLSRSSSRNSMRNGSSNRRRSFTYLRDQENISYTQPDPLGAYTPACKNAFQNCKNAIKDSSIFRNQISGKLDKLKNYRTKSENLINDSFVHKLGETQILKNQLHMARVRARSASYKAQRWNNLAERTLQFNRGPENAQDALIREKLDRPVIKVFQRHPGTQVPEAQEIIKADNQLKNSVISGNEDIRQLKYIDLLLLNDIKSKTKAIDVDKKVLRWRRCKSREMHRK